MKAIFIVVAFCVVSGLCIAQPVIRVEAQSFSNLGKSGYFWQDSTGKTPFEVVEKFGSEKFTVGRSPIFNGGTKGKVWWMKLRFSRKPQTIPYLFIDYASIDSLSLFYRDTLGRIRQVRSGMLGLQKNDAPLGTGYVFPLQQVKGPISDIYLKMQTMNSLLVPVKLVTEPVLNRAIIKEYSAQLIYVGIAVMILIFHIFMFFVTRSKLFALYIARIILLYFIAMVCYVQGYELFLGPTVARFIFLHAHFFIALGYICTILFNSRFLKLKRRLPLLNKVFNILTIGWALILVCSLWDARSMTNALTQFLFFLTSSLFLVSSVKVIIIRGYSKTAPLISFYVLGWIPVALVSIYLVLSLMDIIPFQSHAFSLLTIAGIIEGVMISLGLFGQRLKLLSRHNAHFRRQRIILQEQMEGYKKQLQERTIKPATYLSLKELTDLAHSRDPSFMERFRATETVFIDELLKRSPLLLTAELELCAYMRLNFDTKEIARTCKISVRAVESRKYRIRKKLGIDGETNMQTWILNLARMS
ncbi:7TM diverse intracellular signaling domain-containing protein [Pedobacter sp. GSP4]|uniref:7TM diverse intracellular signaling domain-containing protein n=1 Tax=Pedobacter sp. GSP4 TaxID=3453716 RepID=UPI003EEE4675